MEPSDQRNMLLALVLCFGLFAGYQFLIAGPQQRQHQQELARSKNQAVATTPSQAFVPKPRKEIVDADLAAAKRVPFEAPAIDGTISLVGGRIDDVSLKGYYETIQDKLAKRLEGEVQLMSPVGTERAFFAVLAWKTDQFSTADALWTQTSTGPMTPENPLRLSYTSTSARIDRTITVDANYMFSISDTLTNTGAAPITLTPTMEIHQRALAEHIKPAPGAFAGVIGTYGAQKNQMVWYGDLNKAKGVSQEVSTGWIGLTTKYWMAAAIPAQDTPVTMLASVTKGNGETTFNAGYAETPYTVQPGQSVSKSARVFAGAKRVAVLDQYEKGGIPAFTDAVDWSWMFFITKPFFYLLQIFQGWSGSFGWAILMLTIVVKTVFYPLLFMQSKSMARMRNMQPQMKELQERFAADPQRMRVEQAELWKREKFNPLSGCLPILPTMFVFWALYHTLIVTIEMRHTPFPIGWIQDMSAPDPLSIFNLFGLINWNPGSVPFIGGFLMIGPWALLYGLTMLALQSLSAPPTDPTQRAIMRWIPLVFTILFAGFASGLVIYYVWSNFITVIQQYIVMRHTGADTEIDKFLRKHLGKKKDGGGPGGEAKKAAP